MSPSHLHLFGALLTSLALGVTDHRSGRMPNAFTLSSLGAALLVSLALDGVAGLVQGAIGLFVVAGIPAVLFVTTRGQAIGGGDVKALAALGAWLGPFQGLEVELVAFLLLALFSLAVEARRGRLLALLTRSFSLIIPRSLALGSHTRALEASPREQEMTYVRFGPFLTVSTAISCATLWLAPMTPLPWSL